MLFVYISKSENCGLSKFSASLGILTKLTLVTLYMPFVRQERPGKRTDGGQGGGPLKQAVSCMPFLLSLQRARTI